MPSKELLAALRRDEGCRLHVYPDTLGVYTIGYGHTGPEVRPGLVWTQAQADAALEVDARKACEGLAEALPWVADLDPPRLECLQNMAFNLGVRGLLGFKNTLAAVKAGQWAKAAAGMRGSLWAKQVKGRAERLARQMETGERAA